MEKFDRTTPAGMVSYFRHCIKTGDLKGAMSCFDARGVYIDRSGIESWGLQEIEKEIGNLCIWRPEIKGGPPHVTIIDDLAVWLDAWEMKGNSPDGNVIRMSGHTTCLMQRDQHADWYWLVDNPFGVAMLEAMNIS